jgi:hypothetical protein
MPPNEEYRLKLQYQDLLDILKRYWTSYGRWPELITSPYVHLAIVITALSSGYWLSSAWHATALSVLPNLLGFGVSGFAIWIGWGDQKLREILINLEANEDASAYVQISSIFAHFGLVQVAALLSALICSALDYELSPNSLLAHGLALISLPVHSFSYLKPIGAGAGYFLFVYAIMTTLETTFALFRLATWFQRLARTPTKTKSTLDHVS